VDTLIGEGIDLRALVEVRLAAIGPATAERLQAHGLLAELVPDKHVAEACSDALIAIEEDVTGLTFLLPRADLARPISPKDCGRAAPSLSKSTRIARPPKAIFPITGRTPGRGRDRFGHVQQFIDRPQFRGRPARRTARGIDSLIRAASIGPITSEHFARWVYPLP